MSSRRTRPGTLCLVLVLTAVWGASTALPPWVHPAVASETCGDSNGHHICVTVPPGPLSGTAPITVTNTPNSGRVIFTWAASGTPAQYLMKDFGPSPESGDYSFVWPTDKYLDGSGALKVRVGPASAGVVRIGVTLSNGNTADIRHTADDWRGFLPGVWTAPADPVIPAVGDGPDDRPTANAVASEIADERPPLALYLGDIYDKGTYTENLNHYGVSALDVLGGGTLWGGWADVTQPTVGNHEFGNRAAWTDYWHQRPDFTKFSFGGTLFLDLDSSASFGAGSEQYSFVQDALRSAPACVVAFWHIPVLNGSGVNTDLLPMWKLLAEGGGDLVLNGHIHNMTEYEPLDADLTSGPGAHQVELISGAGGHQLAGPKSDPRIVFSRGYTAGILYLTLEGAASGGTASAISWTFEDLDGNVLRSGSVAC